MRTTIVDGIEAVEGEVIVRYRAGTGAIQRQRAEFEIQSDEAESIGRRGARRMSSQRLSTQVMLQALRNNPNVLYAEPNYVIRVGAIPNDPSFGDLWGLFNTGQTIFGNPGLVGADISAPDAWDTATGSRANVVAVIDTGVDYTHPDLAANIWTAPHAFSVTIDGITITCGAGTHGFNAITNSCNPMDDQSHGTHVAGTIGAVGNNGIGVAGINWVASMMAIKFLDGSGFGSTSDAIKAIEFALQAKSVLGAAANVRVLNNSWGAYGSSVALADQIQAANGADMLFVAAAGNFSSSNDVDPFYPASYEVANVISVASTTNADVLASSSNYGATSVDLGAPGHGVLSTVPNGGYAFFSGTSMATPHVSGAAALMLSQCPATTADLKAVLLETVSPVSALMGATITGGRVNVRAALQRCLFGAPSVSASIAGSTITAIVTNSSGAPRDWLGLFCPSTNNDGAYMSWKYLDGTQTPPAVGLTSATVTFTAPAQGGISCNVRLFSPASVRLAVSGTVTTSTLVPTVTVTTPTVFAGGTINIVVADGPANVTDWLALADSTAPNSQYRDWKYLNGLRTPPPSGLSAATVQFVAPATAGTYNVRWFVGNNTSNRIAISGDITVVAQPTLTINDVSVTEGNSGTTAANFTVSLSPPNASQTVTVAYTTANGTATILDNDYVAASGTLTFAPGVVTRPISVTVRGDTAIEPNETFVVNLSGAVNAVIGDAQAIGTIVSDDVSGPIVSVTTSSVHTGGTISFSVSNGPGNPTDWVALVNTSAADNAYVAWSYLNGSQIAPLNGMVSASLQFTAPLTVGTYDVRVFANNQLTRIARSGPITVSLQPTLTIGDASIIEGNSGTAVATFMVTVSPVNASQTVTVNYATADGTATVADGDYLPASGTLTFTPSTATRTISVQVNGDSRQESNETFVVNLSGATNAVIGDPQAIGTVVTDDLPGGPAPTLTVASPVVGPGGMISFSVLNGPANPTDWVALVERTSADNAYVRWMYLNGLTTAPLTGVANATLQMPAPSAPGTYDLRLFASNRLTLIARSGAITVTAEPTLTIGDVAIVEGNGAPVTATFTVTLSPTNPSQTVTVGFTTGNLTATLADNDYVAASGTLTFPPSTATRTISVTVNGDTNVEPTEMYVLNISGATNAVIGDQQAIGCIVNDDGGPPAVTVASTTVLPGALIEFAVSGGPANLLDWVTLSPAGAPDNDYLDWSYLNGMEVAPVTAQSSAALHFTAPSTPGTYNIRFFADNRLTNKLATSATITVAP